MFLQVSEFSPSTSSAMGLPAEFHEKCRSSFEQYYLQVYFAGHMSNMHTDFGISYEFLYNCPTCTTQLVVFTRLVLFILLSVDFLCRSFIAGRKMLLLVSPIE